MRLGIVRGTVICTKLVPELKGTRFLVVDPVTAENLHAKNGKGGGHELIVADHLNPGTGQMIGVVEGREGTSAYYPNKAPVDAYCSLIVETVDYDPPEFRGKR